MNCVLEHRDGKERNASRGYLCGGCFGRLERTVAELPNALIWLAGHLPSGSGPLSEYVDLSGAHSRPPLRVDVHDMLIDVPGKLTEWCRLVAEERCLRGPQETSPETLCAFLVTHLDWSASQPWVDEMATELFEVARQVHSLAPWRAARHRIPAPCPDCGLLSLVRYDGSDYVKCEGCGRVWPESEFELFVLVVADEQRRKIEADQQREAS